MRKTVLLLSGAVLLWLPAVSAAQANVVLSAATSPATGTSGVTTVSVTGTGFPTGTITAANVTVTLTPASGTAVTTTASAVTVVKGTQEKVSFLVPGTISVPASTVYQVSIAGSTSTGTTFQSSNSAKLSVVSPLLTSLSPNKGSLGQTLSVVVTGSRTTFVQGTTQVSFGPGISVGGAAEGAYGPVTVTSATKATATIVIDNAATVGTQTVTAVTGSQTVSLVNGFTILQPSIASLSPTTLLQGETHSVVITGKNTNFAQGTTQVTFGAGISVGGATEGAYGPVTVTSATKATATVFVDNAAAVGTRTVTALSGTQTATLANGFTVKIDATPPVAVPGGPYSAQLPAAVQFNGSKSYDPTNKKAVLTYNWNFGDGTANGTGATPTHTYAAAGTYNGTLIVTNSTTFVSSLPAPFVVTITSATPVAVPGGPYSVQLPAAVQFNGSASSDPNTGATLTFDWNYGDGTPDGSGAKPTHTYAVAGTYNGTLTVKDNLGFSSAPAAFVANIAAAAPPPQITITSPAPLSVFNASANPVTVQGTVDKPNDTLSVNGVATANSGGSFSATVTLREGQNILTVTATDAAGNVGTASETVTLNTTPPQLGILAPADGSVVSGSTVTVAGNVNEQVPGTINAQQVTVMVNGIAATVSNRTFSAANVPLVQGRNVITAVATDPAGNTSQTQATVTYMGAIPVQAILKVSGELQTGIISTMLPQPLVIQVVNSNGAPVPSQQVVFSVVKSDGVLTSSTQQGQQVTAVTDQNGQASVQFQLGTRVGVGNNQVSVTAPGYTGQALFCENSTVGPPAKILVEMGDAQTGVVGTALASPMVIGVFDAGGNPVAYQPVTFAVETGGGLLNGNSTLQVSTDVNGMASAVLTLGQQEGVSNNVVSATFTGNTGPAASFVSSGQLGGPPTVTSISGLVEDDSNTPVPGATITLEGTNLTAVSDVNGNFLISPAPIGTFLLQVNGHTSTRTDATFPTLAYSITTVSGINNTLGMPVCLPPLDPTSVQTYDPNSSVPLVLQMTGVPGYSFTVVPKSVFNPDGTPYSGPLSLSQVHADRVPMAPPHGSLPLMAGTLQPPGLHFNPPVQTQFPNVSGLAPGTVLDIFSYDHDQMDWVSQGPARVSADGSVITSDPGFGISKSGWHFPPPPPPPPKCASACTTKNPCQTSKCVNGACVPSNANEGGTCSDGTASQQCGTNGKCKSGACTFDSTTTNGQSCTPTDQCLQNPTCQNGTCTGPPVDTTSITDQGTLQGFVFPPGLKDLVNGVCQQWLGFSFDEVQVGIKETARNCCNQTSGYHVLGITNTSGTGRLTVNFGSGIQLAGPPPVNVTQNFGPITIQATEKFGVFIQGSLQINGEAGSRGDVCDQSDNCPYGQANASIVPQLVITGQVQECITFFSRGQPSCDGGGVTGGIKATASLGIRYNMDTVSGVGGSGGQCSSGWEGFFTAGKATGFIQGFVTVNNTKYQLNLEYTPTWIPTFTKTFP